MNIMRKCKKRLITEKIKNKDQDAAKYISTYLFSNSIIKFVFMYFIFTLALFLSSDVSSLSFISTDLFFIVSLVFISFIAILIIALCINKYYREDEFKPIVAYRIFDIYDIFSFVLMSIIVIFFIVLFILTPTVVDGNSMNGSFYDGDRLLVWHLGYEAERDDVVVINVSNYRNASPGEKERFYIKRIVATSGDTITKVEDGNLYDFYVNGQLCCEDVSRSQYSIMTSYKSSSILDENNVIKEGYSIVLGDNRNASTDSRAIGAILNDDIQGKVVFRFYSKKASFGFPKKEIIS